MVKVWGDEYKNKCNNMRKESEKNKKSGERNSRGKKGGKGGKSMNEYL